MSARYSAAYYYYLKAKFYVRLWLFEHCFWLFDWVFGFMRVKFDGSELIVN